MKHSYQNILCLSYNSEAKYKYINKQVKTGNISENLQNKICQITYSSHCAKEITKKQCSNLINSIEI